MEVPKSRHMGPRPSYDFRRLSEFGVLWLINRTVFHPRGFALALEYVDGEVEPIGWSIQGDGSEPWRFEGFDEDETFTAVEGLLAQAVAHGQAPHTGPDEVQQIDGCPGGSDG